MASDGCDPTGLVCEELTINPEVDKKTIMHSEVFRLQSFTDWPNMVCAFPTQLAKAGFYYTGTDHTVQCFSCGGRIAEWQDSQSPVDRHKRFYPNCLFMRGEDRANIPLEVKEDMGQLSVTHPTQVMKEDIRVSARVPENKNVLSERERLQSFRTWPKRHLVQPAHMAAAGLYFVGPGDKVKCAFCGGVIENWNEGDNPKAEHHRYFVDRCPFIRGEQTGNIPRVSEVNVAMHRTQGGIRACEGHWADHPHNPGMAEKSERLKSFQHWPPAKSQRPQSLAEAGFYFTGTADEVRCFFCGGSLRNWQAGDGPMLEHARCFPACDFLNRMTSNHTTTSSQWVPAQSNGLPGVISGAKNNPEIITCNKIIRERSSVVLSRFHHVAFDAVSGIEPRTFKLQDLPFRQELTKDIKRMKEKWRCKICFEEESNILYLPCGHVVACLSCTLDLMEKKCPMCRKVIKSTIRLLDLTPGQFY